MFSDCLKDTNSWSNCSRTHDYIFRVTYTFTHKGVCGYVTLLSVGYSSNVTPHMFNTVKLRKSTEDSADIAHNRDFSTFFGRQQEVYDILKENTSAFLVKWTFSVFLLVL